ncbi:hypothetical protein EC912_102734 [Luteibacter rhizovicinus]|uniref:Alpha/beta hydrolase family protein n=1 Tax=Luteibacter rhizovicinus TaxID=242606 RepID=A0A4R3YYE7_9GAMM|nr:hypothetical protein [Luteibacter rhizovicinus]TCV96383.1 hypothetical protein EC912_102734 [Luteibacter rhizovicinus]
MYGKLSRIGFAASVAMGLTVLASIPVHARASDRAEGIREERTDKHGAGTQVFNLQLQGGGSQRVLYTSPARQRATLVMLPGGSGDVGIESDGDVRHGDNFVVRTTQDWIDRGFAVLIPDALDHDNLRGLRSSPEYASLVSDLVAAAHDRADGPVFLLGTSQGSIAAMNGAAHAREGSIAGVVLTESVSIMGGSHETVFDADPARVRIPALVVANRSDQCDVAPPGEAPHILASMTHSPDKRIIYVEGGEQKSKKACGSLTPHGYYGIEQTVVGEIANWLLAHVEDTSGNRTK